MERETSGTVPLDNISALCYNEAQKIFCSAWPEEGSLVEKTIVAQNKKAFHDYFILESYEAGISLRGTEVKSLRERRVNLKDGYARVEDGELFLHNVHISPYSKGSVSNHDPLRSRKLLMHKSEIRRLEGKSQEPGMTLVPLKMYFVDGKAKVELGLARGKKSYDKREVLAKKTAEREIERTLKARKDKGALRFRRR